MRRATALAAVLGAASCAQILGLDSTRPPGDASVDAPSACDGAPLCTGAGRQLCGQLRQTGTSAGAPFRVAAPTGSVCVAPSGSGSGSGRGSDVGPCALSVIGGSLEQIASGSGTVSGAVDDCGRFAVDLDPALPDVAVVFAGPGFATTGRLVRARPATPGSDRADAVAVTQTTLSAWSSQLGPGSDGLAIDVSTGFLVLYTTTAAAPLAGEQAAADGSSPFTNPPGAPPWAAYFTGAFDALDATATHTGATGAALVDPGPGSGAIDGFRTGKRCSFPGTRTIDGTLLFIVETDC